MIIKGKVISGDKLGRTIGFPTANLDIQNIKIPLGVYASKITLGENTYFGITHIGKRLTLGENIIKVEVHIFNFDKEIYGKLLQAELIGKVRGTKKFNSLEDLKLQIQKDIKNSREILYS